MSLILVFLGPPGAGKGTQAKLLSAARGIAHISTGDMFRSAAKEGTELGRRVQAVIDSGELVSDEMTIELVKARTAKADCDKGYILDGFPRTIPQAEALGTMLSSVGKMLTTAILLNVTEEDVKKRLALRQSAEQRADDDLQVQLERIRVYQQKTAPLIDFYDRQGALVRLDGSKSIEEVSQDLLAVLKQFPG